MLETSASRRPWKSPAEELVTTKFISQHKTCKTPWPTWVFHVAHDPVHGSVDADVARVVDRLPAGLQREAHLTQLRHGGVIQHRG